MSSTNCVRKLQILYFSMKNRKIKTEKMAKKVAQYRHLYILLIFVEIPYRELNEIESKHFLKKFHKFTNNSFRMVIT